MRQRSRKCTREHADADGDGTQHAARTHTRRDRRERVARATRTRRYRVDEWDSKRATRLLLLLVGFLYSCLAARVRVTMCIIIRLYESVAGWVTAAAAATTTTAAPLRPAPAPRPYRARRRRRQSFFFFFFPKPSAQRHLSPRALP